MKPKTILKLFIAIWIPYSIVSAETLGLKSVVEHVNADASSSWTADSKSKFESWSMPMVKSLMGVLPVDHSLNTIRPRYHVLSKIPESFDARTNWPNCPTIREIRDQGACGSCWAIAAASTMSDRICIHSQSKKQVHISAEHLTSCVDDGCNGGWPQKAFEYFRTNGIVSGGNYDSGKGCQAYRIPSCEHHVTKPGRANCEDNEETTRPCSRVCFTNQSISFDKDKSYGKSTYTIANSESQIQLEIMKNGPVEATMHGYADFLTYKSGVYQHKTGNLIGDHAVKLLGWGVDKKIKYWLAANSWNNDWGENGYFRILRGQNECGIEGGIVAGLPKLN